jgi:group I intron endonuclease
MIIYKITNKINQKVYIGQTIYPLWKRWSGHCSPQSKCTYISHAIQKYGKENFTVEEVDKASSRKELNEKEEYWINFYDSRNQEKGYNLLGGGNARTHSDISKKKMSESRKGKKLTEEHKKNIGTAGKGKKRSKETCENIRKGTTGKKHRPWTEEEKIEIGKRSSGRKHTPETIQKMREAQAKISHKKKAYIFTEEHKQKLREARKGRVFSEEIRRKISESNKRTKALKKLLTNPES